MRILHINCNYIGTTLHQLMVEELDKFDITSKVFVPTYDKSSSVIKPNDNVQVSECFNKIDRISFLYKQRKIIQAAEKLYDVKEFDLIHAYTLFTDGNVARTLSNKYNVPFVVAIRNTDVNDFFRLRPYLIKLGIKIMRDAKAVFFLSQAYKTQVFDKYLTYRTQKLLQRKCYIIPNGIDDFWFENAFSGKKIIDKKEIKLIYAGRIDKNKNIPMTQRAIEILEKRGYRISLTVIGKTEDQKEYLKIYSKQNTTCLRPLPKEKLISEYRKANIFVMPSKTESFGLVYVEALSQGLPVIYSRGQGFDKQFPEGKVGYSVDSRNPYDIANGIKRVIDNYEKITGNCIECASKFNWNDICREYVTVYQSIVSKVDTIHTSQENNE